MVVTVYVMACNALKCVRLHVSESLAQAAASDEQRHVRRRVPSNEALPQSPSLTHDEEALIGCIRQEDRDAQLHLIGVRLACLVSFVHGPH